MVTDYFAASGLQTDLDALGFNLVGYGCTTCIGNSGPLPQPISEAIGENDLVAVSVLSGNRNFEGRVSPRRAGQLPGQPAAGRRLCAGRHDPERHGHRSARPYARRQAGLSEGHLADQHGGQRHGDGERHRRHVPRPLCRRVYRRRTLAGHSCRGRCHLPLESGQHLCPEPALFRGHDDDRGRRRRHHRRASAGDLWRFDHHRSHFARRQHQGSFARRPLPETSARSAAPSSTATGRAEATTR